MYGEHRKKLSSSARLLSFLTEQKPVEIVLLILAITLGEVERHGRFEASDRNVSQGITEIQGGDLLIWGSLKGFSLFVFLQIKLDLN